MEFLFQTLKTNYYSCLREVFFKNILYPLSNTRPRYQEILWSRDLLFIFTRSHMILLEIIRELISSCELTEDLCLKFSHEILAEILTMVLYLIVKLFTLLPYMPYLLAIWSSCQLLLSVALVNWKIIKLKKAKMKFL